MNETLFKVLKNNSIKNLFFTLIRNQNGITTNELSDMLSKDYTTISRQIDVLEKAGLVKTKIIDDKYLKKLYYPTLKPFFESIAKSFNVEFTQEDYDNIDNFLFYPTIKDKVFEISKNTNIENNIIASLPTIIFKVFAFIMSQEFQDMIEKDKQLQELFEKYQKTMSKIPFLNLV